MDYKTKYLKYKNKYLSLKNQKGGSSLAAATESKEYIIGNFHKTQYPPLAMAEAITWGTLQAHMTQHGLGTGIYGFVDFTRNNEQTHQYNNHLHTLTQIGLSNPLVLENEYAEKEDEGSGTEYRTDLNYFISLSTNLNNACKFLYDSGILNPTSEQVEHIFTNNNFRKYGEGYKIIPNITILLEMLTHIITLFLSDYNLLMTTTKKSDEYYVLMPINYLMFLMGYDGIYNTNEDSASKGSIKYLFNREVGARGYQPKFKTREPLHGKLIFNPN